MPGPAGMLPRTPCPHVLLSLACRPTARGCAERWGSISACMLGFSTFKEKQATWPGIKTGNVRSELTNGSYFVTRYSYNVTHNLWPITHDPWGHQQASVSQSHPSLSSLSPTHSTSLDGLVDLWTTSPFEKNVAHHIYTQHAPSTCMYMCVYIFVTAVAQHHSPPDLWTRNGPTHEA